MTEPSRAGSAAADRFEPRALRTRTKVLDALRAALSDMPLEELTVAELCRRAGVHRVTFYGHWPDVAAAASAAYADDIDRIAAVDDDVVADAGSPQQLAERYHAALVAQLERVRDERAGYRMLIDSPLFVRELLERLEVRARLAVDALARLGVVIPGAASGIAATHLAGGIVAATIQWARCDDVDADAAAAEFVAQLPPWWPALEH